MRLNLGCGHKPLHGAVNLDVSEQVGADLVHDLNCRPWPFEPDSIDELHAYDVVEHLHDVVRSLEEIHRICRAGALVHITVPHFSSANTFTDVTHRHAFSYRSLDPFTADHPLAFYSGARFRRRATRLFFHKSLTNRLLLRIANRWPHRYEQRWAWIFPAWFLYFELEVMK